MILVSSRVTRARDMELTLSKKINELFRFRGIPQMLVLAGGHMDSAFGQNLIRLQVSIYALDKYLETTWDVKKGELKWYWRDINDCLRAFDLKRNEIPKWRKQIEAYQSHELSLRTGRVPKKKGLRSIYEAKSCDVWLMRKLIFRAYPGLKSQYRLSDWRYYDMITEVHDDVEDIFEDIDGFNGNRFLLSILAKGKEEAHEEFQRFLTDVREAAREHFAGKQKGKAQHLAQWTEKRAEQTRRLLERRVGQNKITTVTSSAIAHKLGLDNLPGPPTS
jgi:hypothetical protein